MFKSYAGNRKSGDNRGLLARLRHDTSGNTLAMIAMATIPLAGMVGSAVDIGRGYLIKSRLQQACDAGALAARRAMAGSSLDAAAVDLGNKFFKVNFSNNTAGSTNVSFSVNNTPDNQVQGVANARVPFTITKALWGKPHVDLQVTCDARLEISNTDVMMVLDVTGSMARCPDDSDCDSGPGSKIVGLREAVLDFFDTIEAATSADARFRIGFVPYSSAVNVGIDPFTNAQILEDDWMVDEWTYQSRVANMTTANYTGTTTFGPWISQTHSSNISNSNCTRYGNNQSFSGYTPAPTTDSSTDNSNPNNVQPNLILPSPTPPPNDVRRVYRRQTASWGSGTRSCTRQYRIATTTYVANGNYSFTNWDYKPVELDVQTFRAGTSVEVYKANAIPSGTVTTPRAYDMVDLVNASGSTVVGDSTVYDGCVEERDTIAQATFSNIPGGAWDMDILTEPFNDNTRWRPMWQELVYDRADVANEIGVTTNRTPVGAAWCPAPSSKLADRTRADVESYVNSLIAVGNTYHDLGMAWGARMLSPTGLWASENATAPNGRAISRHLIFMTDGDMYTPPNVYSAHAYEKLDRRVWGNSGTPTESGLISRHNSRFVALCNAARANNMTVWTVAFGTSNPANLVSCADTGKAFVATNTAALRAQFQAIASQIAELRLAN